MTIVTGLPWKSCHFYCQFFGWRCFYNLSQWSANQAGIAQLTQCCVFSRTSFGPGWPWDSPSCPWRHPGTHRWASQRAAHPGLSRRTRMVTDSSNKSWDLERHQSPPACPTLPANIKVCAVPFELGTSRLEFSTATSCVQNLVYKLSKGSR